jgi:hypothetical protein
MFNAITLSSEIEPIAITQSILRIILIYDIKEIKKEINKVETFRH